MKKSIIYFALSVLVLTSCKGEEPCKDEPASIVEPLVFGNDDEFDNCGTNDAICMCFAVVSKAIRKLPLPGYEINQHWLISHDDPEKFFNGGGSENWPVICRTAKYFKDHDPTWLKRYFEVQKLGDTKVTFLNSEMFSGTYTALTVGAAVAAMKHARDKGHSGLISRGSEWFRTYWSYLALTAGQPSAKKKVTINANGERHHNLTGGGYSTAIVGNRNYVNRDSDNGFQTLLLNIALEHPSRGFTGNLSASPGFYGGVRIAAEALGYRLDSKGKVNFKSRSVPSRHVGLSDDERNKLKTFINSGGTKELPAIYSMVEEWALKCTVTIMRTETGTITWMGDSEKTYKTCGLNKGGPLMVSKYDGSKREVTFLSRTIRENKPSDDMGEVWREGNKVCGISRALPKACVSIPAGNVVYEIRVNKNGMSCIQGDCTIPEGSTPMMVELLYEGLLFRGSDTAGMRQWKDYLLSYENPWDGYAPASEEFVQSGEFVNEIMNPNNPRYQPNKKIAHRVYQTYLDRCAEPGELEGFVSMLEAGNAVGAVKTVLSSSEFLSKRDAVVERGVPTYKECKDPVCTAVIANNFQ